MDLFPVDRHPEDGMLRNFLAERLDREQTEWIAGHVEQCDDCERLLDRLSELPVDDLPSLFPSTADDAASGTSAADAVSGDVDEGSDPSQGHGGTHARFCRGDRYFITGEIASGGMGVVYRGFDKQLKREIAIKVASGAGGKYTDAEARFYREAQICGRLEHPGVVPVHELGHLNDGRMFIAMKLVEGETLETIISSGKEPPARLLEIFNQVCHTMAYAHSRDIVHRDLKPRNIMVGAFGEVQIMDWGLAKKNSQGEDEPFTGSVEQTALPGMTRAGAVLGTPGYMSPEQARGEEVDLRTDVFALGGILCRILTGSPPFETDSERESFDDASQGRIENSVHSLNQCGADPELVDLAVKCLAVDADDRPDDAREVDRLLYAYLVKRDERLRESELQRARQVERNAADSKRRRQRFWFASAIAVILLGTAAATILYLAEKNARQVDQFATQNREFEDLMRRESEIRRLLNRAEMIGVRASTADTAASAGLWNEAKLLIDAASSHVCECTSGELIADLDDALKQVQQGTHDALEDLRATERDLEMIESIRAAEQLASYPDSMLLIGANEEVLSMLEAAFTGYGIDMEADVDHAARIFASSEIQDVLIRGLQLWQKQLDMAREDVSWFGEMFAAVDPHEFRSAVRSAFAEQDRDAIRSMLTRPEAIESPITVHTVTVCLRGLDMFSDLLPYLQTAQRRFPDDYLINWNIAAISAFPKRNRETGVQMKADYELARQHLLICRAMQPDNPGVLANLSSASDKLGNREEALGYLDEMVLQNIAVAQAYISMAAIYQRMGEIEKANDCCELGLDFNPEVLVGQINNSILLRMLGRNDEALAAARRAVRLKSDDRGALRHLAICQAETGDIAGAHESISTALRLHGPSTDCLVVKSTLFALEKRWEEFLDFNRKWSELDPDCPHPKMRQCDALIELDYAEAALNLATVFMREHPEDPGIMYVYCRALVATGRSEEALEPLDRVLELKPDLAQARGMRRAIRRRLRRQGASEQTAGYIAGCEELQGAGLQARTGPDSTEDPVAERPVQSAPTVVR